MADEISLISSAITVRVMYRERPPETLKLYMDNELLNLEKGPAAFGLVSFLMHEGLERHRVRKHLIIFSMAAPLMAIFTFIILKSVLEITLFNYF